MNFRNRFSVFFCCIALAAPTVALAQDDVVKRDYVWLTAGEPAGSQTVLKFPDGRLSISFEFNDRGRGPDIQADVLLDKNGLPTMFTATGVNYSKARVDERFEIEDGVARWHSSLEQGQTRMTDAAIYATEQRTQPAIRRCRGSSDFCVNVMLHG